MSKNKNQKNYNRQVMESGLKSNQYINESLANLNKYTNNYADRLDFWSEKLNNKQLELLQDKYLSDNAKMLRNLGQFGTSSSTNDLLEQNAYDQQNYLANVYNQNLAIANQLQNNELSALSNNVQLNYANRNTGAQAAVNLDKLNNSWLGVLGGALQGVGAVASVIPGGQLIGAGLQGVGGVISNLYDPNISGELTVNGGSPLSEQTTTYLGQVGKNLGDLGFKLNLGIDKNNKNNNNNNSQFSINNLSPIGQELNRQMNRSTLDTNVFKNN